MKYFQLFRITGVANAITYDDGLKSTEAEKKRLVACHIQMNSWAATDDNEVQGYHERAKVFDLPERLFNTERLGTSLPSNTRAKRDQVPVDLDIPVGESFKVAIKCASQASNIRGAYEYEIIS
ncbi:unnamed protein product [marine sediment metagenome]|uniref:Uncharacterized protein n=1 Tax=marine sediment metagenome TaxID=412755 RepID=X1DKI7_9ZZZZ